MFLGKASLFLFLLLPLRLLLLLAPPLPATSAATFKSEKFNDSNLDSSGCAGASIRSNAIRVTNKSESPQPVRVNDSTLSFTTSFVFPIIPSSYPSLSGHGMAFIITPYSNTGGVISAQYLGLFYLSSMGRPYNHLFAVEIDTIMKEEFQAGEINEDRVGVALNGLISVDTKPAGYWIGNEFRKLDLNNGHNIQAWIDYDNLRRHLNITMVEAGLSRPQKPLISLSNINLSNIVEEEMYVGFTESTENFVEDHCVLAWSFKTNGSVPIVNVSHLVTSKHSFSWRYGSGLMGIFVVSFLILLIFSTGASLFIWLQMRRKKKLDSIEGWEIEFWPHRFSYRELHTATKGFPHENLLGHGGFGRVYRGTLPSDAHQIAVKCMFKESCHGRKEFIAEIESLGRLQHPNLVPLRGFCRKEKQLFIVYDYMPNGSLDKMIFGNPKTELPWPRRYIILRDVAAGLLFLHEEWEQRVLHRDIKSSNVLLDAELRGRIGDFGLARLSDHNENPKVTHIVGTLGYIAPELINTGRATTSTDVFSYGILMMEVACGREPMGAPKDGNQNHLTQWVEELYVNDRLMDAADPKLGGLYVEEEMERVLKLGLVCSNACPDARPRIRQVVEILDGKASLSDFLPSPTSWGRSLNGARSMRRASKSSGSRRADTLTSKHLAEAPDAGFSTTSSKGITTDILEHYTNISID